MKVLLLAVAVGVAGSIMVMMVSFAQEVSAPPVVPGSDPAVDHPLSLVPEVRGKHPRLLFSTQDVPAMQRLAQGEGKAFYDALLAYLPVCRAPEKFEFLTDDTDGIRQGQWRMPTVGLHYVLTKDKASLERGVGFVRMLLSLDHWQSGEELDSGMGAANILAGAALLYDWLYDGMDPALQEAFRQKLLLQARRMYYGGHLQRNPDAHYWQQDPQNNHRWHRDAGLALAVLAIADDGPGDEWIRARTFEELRFVHEWLPEDGTSHESASYMVFGMPYLVLAMHASDRCFGTHYLKHPFFRNAALYRMQTLTPGFKDAFPYGDSGGTGFLNNYAYKCAAEHQLKDVQAGLRRFNEVSPDSFDYGWYSLVWYDPKLTGGAIDRLPTTAFYPDLGVALVRDSWKEDAVAAMFKCGPYGGRKLNEYRNANNLHYINVAHDDPDANMFTIFADGELVADDDRYSEEKMTNGHNTILVNGKGQKGEGDGWTQPLPDTDMMDLATITTWKDAGDVAVAEGEASGMYSDLTRYRRTFIWANGRYLLILDDIRAKLPAGITWLVQGSGVDTVDAAQGAYRLVRGKARCDFRVVSERAFSADVVDSSAQSRGTALGYKQLQVKAEADQWRLASLFDPWHRGLNVAMRTAADGSAVVNVTGAGVSDSWSWRPAPDNETPSALRLTRGGKPILSVGPKDKAPKHGGPVAEGWRQRP